MAKLVSLIFVLVLTGGCEMVQTLPPARGRVVDAGSLSPLPHAEVVRVWHDISRKTTTDADGCFRFHGKWRLQVALGDPLRAPRSYRVAASGYRTFETNCVTIGWATFSETDDLGTIFVTPQ